jgi:hypothetical protein
MMSLSARGLWVTCLSWCISNNTSAWIDKDAVAGFQGLTSWDDDSGAVNELLRSGFFTKTKSGHFELLIDGFVKIIDDSGDSWAAVRKFLAPSIFRRDGHKCVYCGSINDLCIDHVVPQINGGTHDMDNLVTACRSCNSSKKDKSLAEWQKGKR